MQTVTCWWGPRTVQITFWKHFFFWWHLLTFVIFLWTSLITFCLRILFLLRNKDVLRSSPHRLDRFRKCMKNNGNISTILPYSPSQIGLFEDRFQYQWSHFSTLTFSYQLLIVKFLFERLTSACIHVVFTDKKQVHGISS